MGTGLNEELLKVEHTFMLLVTAGITVHLVSKYTAFSADIMTFSIFGIMCIAGYFALKSAKELISSIEEKKMAYEAMEARTHLTIRPSAFCNKAEITKYATSVY